MTLFRNEYARGETSFTISGISSSDMKSHLKYLLPSGLGLVEDWNVDKSLYSAAAAFQ